MVYGEQPQYVLPQKKSRALIPKFIILAVLGVIFYLGVLLNVVLLDLTASQETTIKLTSLIILIILIGLGIYLAIRRSKLQYIFYRDRLIFGKEEMFYHEILNTKIKKDIFDVLFHTYGINLGHDFHLRHIHDEINLENYLNQLIAYTRR
ncbi:MAG: hypothetical protein Q8Q01_00545 [archaeon]|nr:hypothetical protein [archaeon]